MTETRDDRLQAFRRAFKLGDFTDARAFVTELARAEDQVARLHAAYRRSSENFPEGRRPSLGFGQSGVARQLVRTVHNAKKTGGRGWGYSWSRVAHARISGGGPLVFHGPLVFQERRREAGGELAMDPPERSVPLVPVYSASSLDGVLIRPKASGWKLLVACFADWNLGIATVGIRALLGNERITNAWPCWKGATKRTRDEALVPNLTRWALDDEEKDRAFFVIETPSAPTRHSRGKASTCLDYHHELVVRMTDLEDEEARRLLRGAAPGPARDFVP